MGWPRQVVAPVADHRDPQDSNGNKNNVADLPTSPVDAATRCPKLRDNLQERPTLCTIAPCHHTPRVLLHQLFGLLEI